MRELYDLLPVVPRQWDVGLPVVPRQWDVGLPDCRSRLNLSGSQENELMNMQQE